MLGWPDYLSWMRDNRWQPLDMAPTDRPVDVFCHGYDRTRRDPTERNTGKRIHGARWNGTAWAGIPDDCTPQFWTEAMSAARIRALSA